MDYKEPLTFNCALYNVVGWHYYDRNAILPFDEYSSTKEFVFQVVDNIQNLKNPKDAEKVIDFLVIVCNITQKMKLRNVYLALSEFFRSPENSMYIELMREIDYEKIYCKLLIFFDKSKDLKTRIESYTRRSICTLPDNNYFLSNDDSSFDYLTEFVKYSLLDETLKKFEQCDMDSVLSIFYIFDAHMDYASRIIQFDQEMIPIIKKGVTEQFESRVPDSFKDLNNVASAIFQKQIISRKLYERFYYLWDRFPRNLVLKSPNNDNFDLKKYIKGKFETGDGIPLSAIDSFINETINSKTTKKVYDLFNEIRYISEEEKKNIIQILADTNSNESITNFVQNVKKLLKKAKNIKRDSFGLFLADNVDFLILNTTDVSKLYQNPSEFAEKRIKSSKNTNEQALSLDKRGESNLKNGFEKDAPQSMKSDKKEASSKTIQQYQTIVKEEMSRLGVNVSGTNFSPNNDNSEQSKSKRELILSYRGIDYLFVKKFQNRYVANFSKIEIKVKDINDINNYPFEISIRYMSDDNSIPILNISNELMNCITISTNTSNVTIFVHFNNYMLGNYQYKGMITINNFVFPFIFDFNIIDTTCYIEIPGFDFYVDQTTNRPTTIINDISPYDKFVIEAFDSNYNPIPHLIDIYGNVSIEQNDEKTKSIMSIPTPINFGIVIHTSKQEYKEFFTGVQFFFSNAEMNVEMFYFHPGKNEFIKSDKIFSGLLDLKQHFYVPGFNLSNMKVEIAKSELIETSELEINGNIFDINVSFKRLPEGIEWIEFKFCNANQEKTIKFEVVNATIVLETQNEFATYKWNYEELNPTPCLHYDIDENIFKPIVANQFIKKPEYKFIVVGLFNYAYVSYDEPNIETSVSYNNDIIYHPNVTNYCFLVLENNKNIKIIRKEDFNPYSMIKICSRLCDYDFNPENDNNEKWKYTWLPIHENVNYIDDILRKMDRSTITEFNDKFFKFIREYKLPLYPISSYTKAIKEVFIVCVKILKKTKYQLRYPMGAQKFKAAHQTLFRPFNPALIKINKIDRNENDVIKFSRNEISILNSNDITFNAIDQFSCEFGDFSTNDDFNYDFDQMMNIENAIRLCSVLPFMIHTHNISNEDSSKIYKRLFDYHSNLIKESNDALNIHNFDISFEFMKLLISEDCSFISINTSKVIKNTRTIFDSICSQSIARNDPSYSNSNALYYQNYQNTSYSETTDIHSNQITLNIDSQYQQNQSNTSESISSDSNQMYVQNNQSSSYLNFNQTDDLYI
ncbi:hypothetical protein TVAG_150580 [Trichomonas vaginalis G3]|uniref:Uncharacterized protein n=1 Tax=Trichomonas vaginalis (strain ATCC PRA-98 / G3) TaxID=412133 RepID=A2DRW0_TRIV3|nr:zebrafish dkey-56m19.5 family [Trichomonas vaginalis G3]EAY16907.1 hypothetical protein TVAG_150580 [Trichomonas vaginalis G3]KAI5489106.1 zebrafish dkey-56m19.5 family [Trichomonas vaginalis G3]|eukprot:XP_001329130.1 hypothetical protein [Trichomonas vaginalis G3]